MPEPIRVEWGLKCPFLLLVEKWTAQAARRWGLEPTEALGYVWEGLRSSYVVGNVLDPRDNPLLRAIIERKVNNCYRKNKSLGSRYGWASLGEAEEVKSFNYHRVKTPVEEAMNREVSVSIYAAIERLPSRQRDAVRFKLGLSGAPTVNELARIWGTTPQNVRKHAKKAVAALRTSLDRFA
jgi:hypothetical protein